MFQLAKATNQRPSVLCEIDALCERELGYPSSWVAHQFDNAVTWFGQHVESKLLETTRSGKPRYDLETLLRSKAENTALSLQKAMKRGYVQSRR